MQHHESAPTDSDIEAVARAIFPHTVFSGYNDETKQIMFSRDKRILETYARVAIAALVERGWKAP